jgi:hypothetical protein
MCYDHHSLYRSNDREFMAMNCVRCRSLALAALLCGAGPVMADETLSNRLLDPALVREQGTNPALQLINRSETDLLRSFTGETLGWGNNRFALPLQQETWRLDSRRSLLINALAIEWQHSLNANHFMSLSARRGDSLYADTELAGSSGTSATLSWSSLFGSESRIIGRLYVGDESAKERSNGNTDRRYYGLQVEGRYNLLRDHAPFASLTWQRSNVETLGNTATTGPLLRSESYSLLGAGWNWQVSPSWDVRAEANYRLADDSVDAVETDRTQLYFSTRYGFR